MAMGVKGLLITFEGSEGSGKSTQIDLIFQYLKNQQRKVVFVREPGGVVISEKIREILLDVKNKNMNDACETLLYMASRAQLVDEVIRPALEEGAIVLSDRYLDSTFAYQGYGNGVDLKAIKSIGKFATGGISPDITFLFDIEAATGLGRIQRAKDRIEQRALDYHNRVRQGYLALAKAEPRRICLIKVNDTKEAIHARVRERVDKLLKRK